MRGDFTSCRWEPVGTLAEYLAVNLEPTALPYLDADREASRRGVRLEPGLVIGAGATLAAGASLRNAVVWDDEQVPAGIRAEHGIFAGGRFHPVAKASA